MAAWWWNSVLGPNIDMDVVRALSSAEAGAFGLGLCVGWESSYDAPPATNRMSTEYLLQDFWATLKQARAALQAQ
jgi:hypothetical protein